MPILEYEIKNQDYIKACMMVEEGACEKDVIRQCKLSHYTVLSIQNNYKDTRMWALYCYLLHECDHGTAAILSRALTNGGLTSIDELKTLTVDDLLNLRGIGIGIIILVDHLISESVEDYIKSNGLNYKVCGCKRDVYPGKFNYCPHCGKVL